MSLTDWLLIGILVVLILHNMVQARNINLLRKDLWEIRDLLSAGKR